MTQPQYGDPRTDQARKDAELARFLAWKARNQYERLCPECLKLKRISYEGQYDACEECLKR